MGWKWIANGYKFSPQEQFAFEDLFQSYFHLCTWEDTVQGTLFLQLTVMLIAH